MRKRVAFGIGVLIGAVSVGYSWYKVVTGGSYFPVGSAVYVCVEMHHTGSE